MTMATPAAVDTWAAALAPPKREDEAERVRVAQAQAIERERQEQVRLAMAVSSSLGGPRKWALIDHGRVALR